MTNWKIKTISSLCEKIYSGGTPNTKKREYWNGDLKWLSSGETRNKFIFNTEKRITELGAKKSSTRLAHSGDVVMASAGQGYTRGQVSLLKTDTYINQSVIVFKSNSNELLSEYLFYNLSNRYEELRALSDSNSIRGSITTKLFNSIEMIIPPLNIQKQIVETLRSLDEKIENNKKINHHLSAPMSARSATDSSPDIRRGKRVSRSSVRREFSCTRSACCWNRHSTVSRNLSMTTEGGIKTRKERKSVLLNFGCADPPVIDRISSAPYECLNSK